jgi:hypothetical protein
VRFPGFEARLTYYDIHFTDRIATPGFPLTAALSQPDLFSSYIGRNPSSAEVNAFAAAAGTFANLTAIRGLGPVRGLSDVTAIADNRTQNIASTDVQGLDMSMSFKGHTRAFDYGMGVSGTYLINFKNRARPSATPISDLNTLGRPVDFRSRGVGTISRGGGAATMAINYLNHYWDRTHPTPVPIASWTTVDLQLRYRMEPSASLLLGGLEFDLNCLNCVDRQPPFASSATLFEQVGYDAANANPLGRVVTLFIKKQW